jgi:hypothetical protein
MNTSNNIHVWKRRIMKYASSGLWITAAFTFLKKKHSAFPQRIGLEPNGMVSFSLRH